MKNVLSLIALGLLLTGQPRLLWAQQTAGCHDILVLKDWSRMRGHLEAYAPGDSIRFRSVSGILLVLPPGSIRRIIQRCPGQNGGNPYTFREKGWYHHTRSGMLPGQTYFARNALGMFLHHSSGWKFNRWLSAGLGAGFELFDLGRGSDAATYPIFAELGGYLLDRRLTPYYSIAAGWAFTGNARQGDRWNYMDTWNGGWMAQASVGYRLGNHLILQTGLRLQRKDREWTSVWGPENGQGIDRILQKRLLLGVGVLL